MPQTGARKKEIYHYRKAKGLCVVCAKGPPKSGVLRCEECLKKLKGQLQKTPPKRQSPEDRKAYWGKIRADVLAAYGGYCKCCGESEPIVLTIDHVHNDGKKHRDEVAGRSHSYYLWLRRNNYPQENFQCLCYNCNIGKYRNGGVCPHETSSKKLLNINAQSR